MQPSQFEVLLVVGIDALGICCIKQVAASLYWRHPDLL